MGEYIEGREEAIERLKEKSDFKRGAVAYVLVNALLVIVWATTNGGFFWPIWPIAGWGLALALQGWKAYTNPLSEERIRREMER
jgi:hypothetical protein